MASYATQTDMETHYGVEQVLLAADRDGDGVADTGVITAALTKATEEIDSYLAVRYDLPLATVPGVLMRVCSDLAMFHMSPDSSTLTEEKRERYKDGIAWLKDLSRGLAVLGSSEEQEGVQDIPTIAGSSETRAFTRTTMRGVL